MKTRKITGLALPPFNRFIALPILGLLCLVPVARVVRATVETARTRDVTEFPGPSIVEKIQAAIRGCGSAPCAVFIPAGQYSASAITNWKTMDRNGARVGVTIPSNVSIQGAGEAQTIIEVDRFAADPPATLFENSSPPNQDIRISELTLNWNDASSEYDWADAMIFRQCDHLELDHLRLEGNPNKLVNLLDDTRVAVHDDTFLLRTTAYGHGDSALSVSRFEPAISVMDVAGVVRNNEFTEIGNFATFSMLVVSQSGLDVISNSFARPSRPDQNDATGIEMGQDNTGRLPSNVRIRENRFQGASIAFGGLNNSEISSNTLFHGNIYIALQTGTVSSLAGLTIADNELHYGSISINGLENVATTRIRLMGNLVFDGTLGVGNSKLISDVEVDRNTVLYSNNTNGIDCNACSLIRSNTVRDIGQNGVGDVHAGYQISGNVHDVSDNVYIDDQHDYDSGSICSVTTPASKTCATSGKTRWVLLHGGDWAFGWTNRTLFTAAGNYLIHAFVRNNLLELEHDTPFIPEGTRYHLYETTFIGFEINGAAIERFANNLDISPNAPFRRSAVQEDGTVQIQHLFGNVFSPYRCVGACRVDYRSVVNAPN